MVSELLFDLNFAARYFNRQLDDKLRSGGFAMAFDLPAHFRYGASHDEQPQAGPVGLVGHKGIEDAVLKFSWRN